MKSTNREKAELRFLLTMSIEDRLADEGIQRLNDLLATYADLEDYYFKCIKLQLAFRELHKTNGFQVAFESNLDEEFWADMAEYEKIALPVETHEAEPEHKVVDKVVYPSRVKTKPSKLSLFALVASAAAMVMVILFVRLAPPSYGSDVATVVDVMNATWAQADRNLEIGSRLWTQREPLRLERGIVEIRFDDGVEAVIEGPAEFQLITGMEVALSYGRLYARVFEQGKGFAVLTGNSRVIDLGTEFGINADNRGGTEVQVFKGQVSLIAGRKGEAKQIVNVEAGNAREIDSYSTAVREIPLDERRFVQGIDSRTGLIWKGQKALSLSDIAGGGNGLGTGRRDFGVDPGTGDFEPMSETDRLADNAYRAVQDSSFIDGVFVPNGDSAQVVTSEGHIFDECPPTEGQYYSLVANLPSIIDRRPITLGGIDYSRNGVPFLFMHSNVGITYDLKAIQSQLEHIKVVGFKSILGVSENAWRDCDADFWVLVDGKLKYSKRGVKQKGVIDEIDIEIPEDARFLTLIATDGTIKNERKIDSDWCVFGQPVLILR